MSQISDRKVRDATISCLQIRRVALRGIQTCKLNSSFIHQVNNHDSQISRKSLGITSAINTSCVVTHQGMYFDIPKNQRF